MSTKDHILDALEQLLITGGERAATVEAVAVAAGVSKGGLLYHFGSKDKLVAGLISRLLALADADAALMAAAPQGPAAYYVATSTYQGSALDRTLVAMTRLVQDSNPAARDAMERIQQVWHRLILAEVGDAAIARAIVLLGDGLYYNAALAGIPSGSEGAADGASAELAALLHVVDLLKAQAAA